MPTFFILQSLNLSLTRRIAGYRDIRKRIAHRACMYFQSFVGRRGYSGTLNFDLDKKKLDIIVSTEQ